jgi:periplasmic protein TonB
MNKFIFSLLAFCFFNIVHSQEKNTKVFFNNELKKVDSLAADFYVIYIFKDSKNLKGFKKKYKMNGQLVYEAEIANLYRDKKPIEKWQKNGKLKTYNNNGNIKSIKTYKMNKLNGSLITFYKNGKVRRSDFFKNNKFVYGKCYTENGIETKHYDYEVLPEYKGGIKALLKTIKKNLRYPDKLKKNPINGKVYVKFTVKKNGTIANIMTRASNKEFEKEAIRVVKLLKKWKPGKRDGEYDDFTYSLPINFKLY